MTAKRLYLLGISLLFLSCGILRTTPLKAQDCVDLLVSYQPAPDSLLFLILDRETGIGKRFIRTDTESGRPIVNRTGQTAVDADNQIFYFISTLEETAQGVEQAFLRDASYAFENIGPRIPTSESLFELQYSCEKKELYALDWQVANPPGLPPLNFAALVTVNADGDSAPIGTAMNSGEGIVEGVSTVDGAGEYFYYVFKTGTDFVLQGLPTSTANPPISTTMTYEPLDLGYDPVAEEVVILTTDFKIVRYNVATDSFSEVGTIAGISGTIKAGNAAYDPTTDSGSYFMIADNGATHTLYEVDGTNASIISSVNIELPFFNLLAAVPCVAKADFLFENTCVGEATVFTDISVGAEAWEWDFGDGTAVVTTQNPTHSFSAPGTYDVFLEISGCSVPKDTTIQVVISEAPSPDLFDTLTACNDMVVLDAGDVGVGATYFWLNNSTEQTLTVNRGSGDRYYWVDVSIGSCTVRDSTFVTFLENDYGSLSFPATQVLCQDPPITLDAGENIRADVNVSYLWSTGATTPTIEVTGDGTYSVTISNPDDPTGIHNCPILEATTTITFTSPDDVNFSFGEDVYTCDATYTIDPGDADSYEWSTGATSSTLSVSESGFYSLTITNGECEVSDEILVELISYNVELGGDANGDLTLCATQDFPTLDATPQNLLGLVSDVPAISYLWEDGSTNATRQTNANTSNYSVTVTIGDCSQEDFLNLNVVDDIAEEVNLGGDRSVCSGQTVTLTAGVSGATYLWSTGESTESISVSSNGTYSVTVFGGCDASDEATITFLEDVNIDLGSDLVVCPTTGQVLTLQPNVSALGANLQYLWSDGSSGAQLAVTQGGTYAVTISDEFACEYMGATEVTEQCNSFVQVPTAFSPNGDNLNDVFLPRAEFVNDYVFRIFDRWGNQVYETTNPEEGWDGLTDFEPLPLGVYVWVITYTNEEEDSELLKGNVTLIR